MPEGSAYGVPVSRDLRRPLIACRNYMEKKEMYTCPGSGRCLPAGQFLQDFPMPGLGACKSGVKRF
jgi:hypothetical protein